MALESVVRNRKRKPVAPHDGDDTVHQISRGHFSKRAWAAIRHIVILTMQKTKIRFFFGMDDRGFHPTLELRLKCAVDGLPVLQQVFRNPNTRECEWRDVKTVPHSAEASFIDNQCVEYPSTNTGEKYA